MVDGIWKQFSMDMTAKQPGLGTIEWRENGHGIGAYHQVEQKSDIKMHYVFPEKCYFCI